MEDLDCYARRTWPFKQQIEEEKVLEGDETTEIKHLTQQIRLFQDRTNWYSLPSTQLSAASLL